MPLPILQAASLKPSSSACNKLCAQCPSRKGKNCDPHAPCPGYGSSEACPPIIVLAVLESAARALAAATLPAFGSRQEFAR